MSTKEQQKETIFRTEIRTLIEKHGLSINEVARKANIRNTGTLYSYLQDRSEMTGGNIEKVLNYLRSL